MKSIDKQLEAFHNNWIQRILQQLHLQCSYPTDSRRWEMLQVRPLSVRLDDAAASKVAHTQTHGRKAVLVRQLWSVVQVTIIKVLRGFRTVHENVLQLFLKPRITYFSCMYTQKVSDVWMLDAQGLTVWHVKWGAGQAKLGLVIAILILKYWAGCCNPSPGVNPWSAITASTRGDWGVYS